MKCLHIISAALMVALIGSRAPAEPQSPFGPPPQQTQPVGRVALVNHQPGSGPAYGPSYGPAYGPTMQYGSSVGTTPPAYNAGPLNQYVQGYGPAATSPMSGPVYGQPSAANGYANTAPAATNSLPTQAAGPVVTENVYGAGQGGMAPNTFQSDGPYTGGTFSNAMNSAWTNCDGAAACCDGAAACCDCAPCPRWFGGLYGLIMDRVDNDQRYFLMDPAVPSRLYASSLDSSMDSAGGLEARVGRTFCNCQWGLEGVYWGLFPNDEFSRTTVGSVPAATVYMTPDYRGTYLDFNGGVRNPIDTYFNDGSIQTFELSRSFEYHNFEINLLSGPLVSAPSCGGCDCGGGCGAGGGCGLGGMSYSGLGNPGGGLVRPYNNNCCQGPRWQAGWLFGVRYFKFNEGAMLAVDNGDGMIDYSYTGGNNEFFHQITTENHLVGVQLGLNLDYYVTNCLQFEFGSKFGFFNNHANNYQRIFNEFGNAYVDPLAPQSFALRSSQDDVAFLGELRAGLGYKVGCHWRLTGGYRALAASNVATPLDQIGFGRTMGSVNHTRQIDNSSSLILHGAYVGADFAW